MKISPEQLQRLESFLDRVQKDAYPETRTAGHDEITHRMVAMVWEKWPPPPGAVVLDVGCGQGVALERFKERGACAIGITINGTDLQVCRAQGYDVREMDQSLLDFPDGSFDLVWCRHCLEHSVIPYFTLSQFHRVLRAGGLLYVEVPAPDTPCAHQTNRNHYSMMSRSMWQELILRSGFSLLHVLKIDLTVPAGPDVYWGYVGRKAVAEGGRGGLTGGGLMAEASSL